MDWPDWADARRSGSLASRADAEGEGSCEFDRDDMGGPSTVGPGDNGAIEGLRCLASSRAALTTPKNDGLFFESPYENEDCSWNLYSTICEI